jgi:cell division transport system permease protein
MHAIRYSVTEAWRSLWRQKPSAALAVLTIAAAILVLGGFLLVAVNLDAAVARWSTAAEFSIYLRDDITEEQRVALIRMLDARSVVAGRTFVSKTEALQRFRRDFPDLAAGLQEIPQNPLPASIELRLDSQRANAAGVEAFAAEIQRAAGVADVRFDRRWLERLVDIAAGVRVAGWLLGAVLLAAAVLTVATVVRLALHARRDEIEIMQLMGAPLSLLRGPLVMEGLIQGGFGAALALCGLFATFAAVRHVYGPILTGVLGADAMRFLPVGLAALLVVGGMGIGCLGGLVAARHVR